MGKQISIELLKKLYSDGKLSHYFCISKKIDNSLILTIRLLQACNLLCEYCIQGKTNKKEYNNIDNCNKKTYKLIDKLNDELLEVPIYRIYLDNLSVVNEKIEYVKDSLNDYFYNLFNKKY